ncbi:glycosyl hydrolase family 38 protein [Onchocerca flexuosa]|uniref:alpha-mannosidase n=1 Tax=Onchocerca flexuosa TaxID=387005 RepID=A0A238BPP1_9BILA|nr:glycosyl hydrolase family 38 protein [Onchocerca flexuosa]
MNETNAYKAALFKNERTTVERVEKFISEHYFKDCNLRGRLYGRSYPVYVKHCDFGSDIVTFQEAVEALSIRGAEVDIGFKFGPTWTTHWFEIGINLPEDCQSEKKIVLRVDPDCEALLWSVDGRPIKGLSPDFGRTDLAISHSPAVQKFYVEASCSDRGGDGDGNAIGPVKMDKLFELRRCELVEYNATIYDLIVDFELLLEMSKMLPKEGARRYQALYTANDMITVKECLDSRDNFTDHGRSNIAMMLYGFGDGGGGPNKDMLERAERLADCDGVPRVQHATPQEFFTELVKDVDNLHSWKGELYLELHNATYTTQARIKKMNRLLEGVLKDHEFLQSISLLEFNEGKPLTSQWQSFLLNQFHDVLPGSCIKEVVTDAIEIFDNLLDELTVDGGKQLKWKGENHKTTSNEWVINCCNWPRILFYNNRLLCLEPFSIMRLNELKLFKLSLSNKPLGLGDGEGFILENRYITASIDKMGRITNLLVHRVTEASIVKKIFLAVPENNFANQFVIFDDVPLFWDAWDVMDYHLETRQVINSNSEAILIKNTPLEACICVKFAISEKSSLMQYITIFAHLPYLVFDVTVQWHESHKFLKVEFPVNVQDMDAYYDIQFGHVKRPTHRNTSWDAAKYEVVGHKWMALTEFDRGIALLNDCKYGHSCAGNIMTLSLLRASKIPDDTADMGEHRFSYALYPFIGSMQQPCNNLNLSVMRAAYEFNYPIRFVNGWHAESKLSSFLKIDGSEGIVIDTVKPAEDDVNTLVIRLFESFGGGVHVKLIINHSRIISVDLGDGLERTVCSLPIETNDSSIENQCEGFVSLDFRAFEIKTLLLRLFAL